MIIPIFGSRSVNPMPARRPSAIPAAMLGLICGLNALQAQTVNFDVPGGVGAVNYSGLGAAPGTGIYWNAIAYQGTSSAGLAADGSTSTPVTLTDTSPSNFNPGQGTQGTPGGLQAPYAYAGSSAVVTETLNNVPTGTYNLYLYGKNYPYSDRGTAFSVNAGTNSYGTQSTVCSSDSAFTRGNDYVEFTNLVIGAGGGTITFTYTSGTNGGGEGDFNGLQLVTVQPASINFDVPGGAGGVNYSGLGAAPDAGIYWNPIAYKGTTSSGAVASDGVTPTTVTLTDSSLGNFNSGQGTQGTPGGLESPYAYANGNGTANESLNSVPAGKYNLYLYGKNYPYSDRGTAFTVSVGSTSYGTESTVCSADSVFTLGNDYVVFTNIVVGAGGGNITFSYTSGANGGGEGDFNGLQLVNAASTVNTSGPSPGPSVVDVWTGAASSNWDVGTAINWLTNGVAGVYSQGNIVQFNDSSAVNVVNLAAALSPTNVLVNNNSANYVFTGGGSLGGNTNFSLTKEGAAMLTLSNADSFSGNVYVGGGILQVGNAAALGDTNGSTTISNGATLDLNGFNIGNEPVFVQGSGSAGQGAINDTGGSVYPAISYITMTGDTTLGSSGGTWEIKPQSSGGTATLSTGGKAYNLTEVGAGFVGLYGVTVDPALHNIDVQGGTFDLENSTSGSLGDSTGTLTLESGSKLIFYQILNPISKPIVFNDSSFLSNNNGPTTFSGPVALDGYITFGLFTSLDITGGLKGSGPLELQAGSGTLTLAGTNSYAGDIYLDSGVGGLIITGPSSASTGLIYLGNNNSVTINSAFGGSVTDSGATGTSLLGSGTIAGSVDFSGQIDPGQINGAGQLTVGPLTMEAGAVLNMDLSASTTGSNDVLHVNGNLTLNNNALVLNFLQGHLQVGTYHLITYTGTLSGSFGSVSTRAQATLDTSTPGQINLIVTSGGTPANLTWTGSASSIWDIDTSTNWSNTGTGNADRFFSGDDVSFTDLAGVPTTITINGSVAPGAMTVNSSANNFMFDGPGTISGSGSLTKSGSSLLTLNTAGGFTGPVIITAGTLATPGNTLSAASVITVTNTGTLDLAGSSLSGPTVVNVASSGTNNQGAIFNSVGDYPVEAFDVNLTGDSVFGGSARWDFTGGQITGTHHLTIDWSAGAGYGEWNTLTIGSTVAGITLTNGSIGMKFMDTGFQNEATVFTVGTNCQMTFYNGGFNGSIHALSGSQVNIYTAPSAFNGSSLVLESNAQWLSYYDSSSQPVNSAVTLNGVAHFVMGDHDMVYTNVVSGSGGFVEDIYNHAVVLSASNTYTGPTIIGSSGNSPYVALTGSGSISQSALIFFGGNDSTVVRVDASGRSDQTFALASGQTLGGIGAVNGSLVEPAGATISPAGTNTTIGVTTGSNPVGTIAASGNITLGGTTLIKLNGSGTNDAVQSTGGTLTYGGTLDLVNISAAPLAAGNQFQVFGAASYGGSFAGIVPATPGTGLSWNLSQLNSGIVGVTSTGDSGPVIAPPHLTGGNLVFSGTGGTSSGTYRVLTTTNLTTPLANWLPIATNNFDVSGNFSFTNPVTAGSHQQFFLIRQP